MPGELTVLVRGMPRLRSGCGEVRGQWGPDNESGRGGMWL